MSAITADTLREWMESRFAYLHYNDQYHGRHLGEFEFLESVLSDGVLESEQLDMESAPGIIAQGLESETIGERGGSRVVGGSAPSPQLLTGGIPCTESTQNPTFPLPEVPEFSFGSYDGGDEVGFDGTWNPLKFPRLIETLESGKESACDVEKGPEGFALELEGEDVLVMPTGGNVGGLLYNYRFICRGVEF
jgi:hypothetical protein